MIITTDIIKKAKLQSEDLKKKFYPAGGIQARSQKIKDLLGLVESRIKQGVDWCMENAPTYAAIDAMMTVPHRTITTSMVRSLVDLSERAPDKAAQLLNDLGLSKLLTPDIDPISGNAKVDEDGTPVMVLDLPTFDGVLVPLAMEYTTAIWAGMFDVVDSGRYLYKYSPAVPTVSEKIKCDIITSVIDQWTSAIGYRADERQSLYQTVAYGWCLNSLSEPFYRQYTGTGEDKRVVVEGCRWDIGHPANSFYDMAHRPNTMNTDTGCAWFGLWDIVRWVEIKNDSSLWINKDDKGEPLLRISNITTGLPSIFSGSAYRTYKALYPCAMKMPNIGDTAGSSRQDVAFDYTSDHNDYGVAKCTTYHRLIPSDWDLGDYSEPMWFRFVTAYGDTPLAVEAMQYSPGALYLYNSNAHAAEHTGMPIRVAPFGDIVTMLLQQYVISVARNLTNLVFYNRDGLSMDVVRRLEALGAKGPNAKLNFQGVSGQQLEAAQAKIGSLFESVTFPNVDVGSILNGISIVIGFMERVLRISPNDLGGSFSHEVSATEAAKVGAASSTSRRFSLGFIEEAQARKKDIMYAALMVNGSDDVVAEVADTHGIPIGAVKALGFEVEAADATRQSFGVVGKKASLSAAKFATHRIGTRQPSDQAMAGQMMQTMQAVLASKPLLEAAGVDTVVAWWNQIAAYAGVPEDMRIRNMGSGQPSQIPQEQLVAAIMQQVQQMTQEQLAQLGQAITSGAIEPLRNEIAQAIESMAKRLSRVEGASGLPPHSGAVPA